MTAEIVPVEAVIFDYDGLLVDSEEAWFQACRYTCEQYGKEVPEEHRLDLMRSHLSLYLLERYELPATRPEVRKLLYGRFQELAKDIPLMDGAQYAVELLHNAGLPLAIGTGSDTAQVTEAVEQRGLDGFFDPIVGQDQVEHGKPEPDIYLRVAQLLGVAPEACLVFEDQPRGIRAAKAAGMLCIAVPNLHLGNQDYSQADAIISSLGEVSLELIQRVEASRLRR